MPEHMVATRSSREPKCLRKESKPFSRAWAVRSSKISSILHIGGRDLSSPGFGRSPGKMVYFPLSISGGTDTSRDLTSSETSSRTLGGLSRHFSREGKSIDASRSDSISVSEVRGEGILLFDTEDIELDASVSLGELPPSAISMLIERVRL